MVNTNNWDRFFNMTTTNFDPFRDMDANAVAYWLDNYCRTKPTEEFSFALDDFMRQQTRNEPSIAKK